MLLSSGSGLTDFDSDASSTLPTQLQSQCTSRIHTLVVGPDVGGGVVGEAGGVATHSVRHRPRLTLLKQLLELPLSRGQGEGRKRGQGGEGERERREKGESGTRGREGEGERGRER